MFSLEVNVNFAQQRKVEVIVEKESKPKVDRNISIAGLFVTDADTALEKLEREKEGLLKGLYVFRKDIPCGEVYICNGVEFPNSEASDLLLYLIVQLEENNWERKIRFKSIRKLLREAFNDKTGSKFWIE